MDTTKIAIILLNLGGPARTEDIYPFLYDLFMDRNIIPIPLEGPIRKPLAKLLATWRTRRVRQRYQAIGGGSPLRAITTQQAEALQGYLHVNFGPLPVFTAMRYGNPSVREILKQLPNECRHLIAIPLFPQYCKATSGTTLSLLNNEIQRQKPSLQLHSIEKFWDHPLFLDAFQEKIEQSLHDMSRLTQGNPFYLFCAHSVPQSFLHRGDPYIHQIQQTAGRLVQRLNLPADQWQIAYQSQMGPVKWVGPSASDYLQLLGQRGQQNVLLIPLSFVSDHLETLYDMDLVLQQVAQNAGIRFFLRVPCLNTTPRFIVFLAELVRTTITKYIDSD